MALCIIKTLICILYLTSGGFANPLPSKESSSSKIYTEIQKTHFDVLIVGGGPAGLSALGSLARVRRSVLLIDSGEYRNSPSRRVHDVIGSDGTPPALFRSKAREQIARFTSASLRNGTVTSITRAENESSFVATLSSGQKYTSRKIILATGLKDILPNVPGIEDAWGRGMYWCAWCDGWEHRDQELGIITALPGLMKSLIQISNLNKDIIAFVNGTDIPTNRRLLDKDIPGWQKHLRQASIQIENRTITGFERLQDGSVLRNETVEKSYDKFLVKLEDGSQIERSAFLASFPKVQHSYLGANIGVRLMDERIYVDPTNMKAAPGVWGVGDANCDNSTNVPHALYSGKKAAVSVHFELGRENLMESLIMKPSESDLFQSMDNGLEDLWDSIR